MNFISSFPYFFPYKWDILLPLKVFKLWAFMTRIVMHCTGGVRAVILSSDKVRCFTCTVLRMLIYSPWELSRPPFFYPHTLCAVDEFRHLWSNSRNKWATVFPALKTCDGHTTCITAKKKKKKTRRIICKIMTIDLPPTFCLQFVTRL